MNKLLTTAALALRWVSAHIAEYGGDPGKISVSGHSAGAALTSGTYANPGNVYGIGDLHDGVWEWVLDFGASFNSGDSRTTGGRDRGLWCAAGANGAVDATDASAEAAALPEQCHLLPEILRPPARLCRPGSSVFLSDHFFQPGLLKHQKDIHLSHLVYISNCRPEWLFASFAAMFASKMFDP